jgi:STE24 endopeptidase
MDNPTDSKSYQRAKHALTLASLGVVVVAIIAAALLGPDVDRALRGLVGDNYWLRAAATGFVYLAGLELLSLPFDYWSGFVLEHRYKLSNQRFRAWLWKQIKGWLLAAPLGLALVVGLYALLRFTGDWWWLAAAVGWLLLTLVLARILPVLILPLFYKVTKLDDSALLGRLRQLADGTGLGIEGVYRLHLSDETKKANAALAGMGKSRRVLLGDTLLAEFTPEEIEVVFAHEVGHHAHGHLPKMIAIHVLLTMVSLWLADRVLHASAVPLGYPAAIDPAAFPLLLLVVGAFGLVMLPLKNALSRWFERQCDRYALTRTGNPAAYRSAFEKLGRLNKADADPHPALVWLLHDHPPIGDRIAMAGPP